MSTARLAFVQDSVAALLAHIAAETPTTAGPDPVEPLEPDTMTDAQADHEYARDADYAAAAMFG